MVQDKIRIRMEAYDHRALDSSAKEIVELIETMNAAGLTLVVVTHDPSIGGRARRRIRLADGALVAGGDGSDPDGGGGA